MKKKYFASFTILGTTLKTIIVDEEKVATDLVDHYKDSATVKLNKYAVLDCPETLYECIRVLDELSGKEVKT